MFTYNTKIGEFCATHSNWEELLAQEPYHILVKRKDGFVIFNYRQLESDFSNEIVRECRGIIFKEGEWEHPVCHAFDKFFNYGEPNCAELDWGTAKCTEKIDGSIMKLWCYDGTWHVSTNGNIDASDAPVPDVRKDDFNQLFWEGVTKNLTEHYNGIPQFVPWLDILDKDFTYIFEMVSPYTRVVIPYEETDVYFLGARDNISGRQFGCGIDTAAKFNVSMFPRPKIYPLIGLEEIINASHDLPWDEEGYVCYDENFNRCKVKSPKYVMAHFARNNNVITRWHLINIILKGEMDEFITYASDYKDQIKWVKDLMDDFVKTLNGAAYVGKLFRKHDRPKAAELIKNFDKFAQNIMFLNYEKDMSAKKYVENWDAYKWDRVLTQYEKFKERYK